MRGVEAGGAHRHELGGAQVVEPALGRRDRPGGRDRRLRERATESTGEIGGRIELARAQLLQAHRFRYMVRNDDVERATAALCALVEAELAFAGTMGAP